MEKALIAALLLACWPSPGLGRLTVIQESRIVYERQGDTFVRTERTKTSPEGYLGPPTTGEPVQQSNAIPAAVREYLGRQNFEEGSSEMARFSQFQEFLENPQRAGQIRSLTLDMSGGLEVRLEAGDPTTTMDFKYGKVLGQYMATITIVREPSDASFNLDSSLSQYILQEQDRLGGIQVRDDGTVSVEFTSPDATLHFDPGAEEGEPSLYTESQIEDSDGNVKKGNDGQPALVRVPQQLKEMDGRLEFRQAGNLDLPQGFRLAGAPELLPVQVSVTVRDVSPPAGTGQSPPPSLNIVNDYEDSGTPDGIGAGNYYWDDKKLWLMTAQGAQEAGYRTTAVYKDPETGAETETELVFRRQPGSEWSRENWREEEALYTLEGVKVIDYVALDLNRGRNHGNSRNPDYEHVVEGYRTETRTRRVDNCSRRSCRPSLVTETVQVRDRSLDRIRLGPSIQNIAVSASGQMRPGRNVPEFVANPANTSYMPASNSVLAFQVRDVLWTKVGGRPMPQYRGLDGTRYEEVLNPSGEHVLARIGGPGGLPTPSGGNDDSSTDIISASLVPAFQPFADIWNYLTGPADSLPASDSGEDETITAAENEPESFVSADASETGSETNTPSSSEEEAGPPDETYARTRDLVAGLLFDFDNGSLLNETRRLRAIGDGYQLGAGKVDELIAFLRPERGNASGPDRDKAVYLLAYAAQDHSDLPAQKKREILDFLVSELARIEEPHGNRSVVTVLNTLGRDDEKLRERLIPLYAERLGTATESGPDDTEHLTAMADGLVDFGAYGQVQTLLAADGNSPWSPGRARLAIAMVPKLNQWYYGSATTHSIGGSYPSITAEDRQRQETFTAPVLETLEATLTGEDRSPTQREAAALALLQLHRVRPGSSFVTNKTGPHRLFAAVEASQDPAVTQAALAALRRHGGSYVEGYSYLNAEVNEFLAGVLVRGNSATRIAAADLLRERGADLTKYPDLLAEIETMFLQPAVNQEAAKAVLQALAASAPNASDDRAPTESFLLFWEGDKIEEPGRDRIVQVLSRALGSRDREVATAAADQLGTVLRAHEEDQPLFELVLAAHDQASKSRSRGTAYQPNEAYERVLGIESISADGAVTWDTSAGILAHYATNGWATAEYQARVQAMLRSIASTDAQYPPTRGVQWFDGYDSRVTTYLRNYTARRP